MTCLVVYGWKSGVIERYCGVGVNVRRPVVYGKV